MRPHYTDDPLREPACCYLLDEDWFQTDGVPEEVVEGGDEAMERVADHQHSVRPSLRQHLLHPQVVVRHPRLVVPRVEVARVHVLVHEVHETGGASLQWDAEDEIFRQILYIVQMAQWREDIAVALFFILTIGGMTLGLAEAVAEKQRPSRLEDACHREV